MMKVSDPIIFGVAVRTFFRDVFDKHAAAFKEVGVDPNNGLGDLYAAIKRLPKDKQAEIEADIQATYARRPAAGHGQLRQGHHQPARAERRDHRRLDPADDPRLRADVGTGRQAPRDEGGHPRPQLRAALPRGHRALQAARRVRPEDDGHGAERRVDGPAGRRVRLPRQDLPDAGRRHGARRRRAGQDADRARGRGGRHLARVSGEGRADPRLGEARRHPGPDHRGAGGVLARQEPGPRRPAHREGDPVPEGPRHQRARHPHHVRRPRPRASRWSGCGRARTRSR